MKRTPIIIVPLAKDRGEAIVDKADFDLLVSLRVSDQWFLNGRVVRCKTGNRNNLSVARLIMRAGDGEVVKYRDGSRLNLRRANLYTAPGRALSRELTVLERLAAAG
jgi:hypothetical protein